MIQLTFALIITISASQSRRQKIPEPIKRERDYNDDIIPSPAPRSGVILDDSGTVVWPKWSCPIAYSLDDSLTSTESQNIVDGMAYITSVTGWTFVAQTAETDYLLFFDGGGCWSYVGKQTTQPQQLSMTDGCGFGAAVHEIGHALGISHEQSRPDRGTYVTINDNIFPWLRHNFDIENTFNPGDYDFNSIMHYDQWAGSYDGLHTITTNGALSDDVCYIGQRRWLSEDDIIHYNQLIDGSHCSTPVDTCEPTNIWLCAPGTSVNYSPGMFGEYEVGGTCDGKDYYVSVNPPTVSEKDYIYWRSDFNEWFLSSTACTNSYRATNGDANFIGSTNWMRWDGSSDVADSTMVATQVSCTTDTDSPSKTPTKFPTNAPSQKPIAATANPTTVNPTKFPTKAPAEYPTQSPIPSPSPTNNPLQMPTQSPSNNPTEPSQMPTTANPTSATPQPTAVPTYVPTAIVENESMEFAAALFESGEMSEFGGMPNQNHKYSINLVLNVSNVLMVWILVLAVSVAFGIWVCFCYEKKQNVTVQLNEIP